MCSTRAVYDTVEEVELESEEPKVIDLGDLDIKDAKGLFAKIPGQNVMYFINEKDGKTYKFTEESGKLKCTESGDLSKAFLFGDPGFDSNISCVFFAGDMQNPTLHVVIRDPSIKWLMDFYTLNNDQWTKVYSPENLLLSADAICSTTIQIEQKLVGCVCAQGNELIGGGKAVKLYFVDQCSQTSTDKLKPIKVKKADGWDLTSGSLTGIYQVETGKILIGINNSFDLCEVRAKGTKVALESKDFAKSSTTLKGGLYAIRDTNNIQPTMSIPIFCCHTKAPSLYTMNAKGDFVPIEYWPFPVPKHQLVIPFSDAVYVITTRKKPKPEGDTSTTDDEEEDIYYKVKLKGSFISNK